MSAAPPAAWSREQLAEFGYEENHLAWAYLSRVCEGPQAAVYELLNAGYDIGAIAAGVQQRESWIGPLLKVTAARYQQNLAALDITRIIRLGGRMLCPTDREYQDLSLDAAFYFAQEGLWSERTDVYPPHALWVIGKELPQMTRASIAIVGSRSHSPYGARHAQSIAAELASQHHYTVISGGALGIDALAHQHCMQAGGDTIVVFAGGLDALYLKSNAQLFQRIKQQGALVSEYPPGFSAQRHRFLTRNRLVAALATGTVVIEAGYRSGALNTLSWAAALGKTAMVLPGPAESAFSRGCHERLRQREAELVLNAADIVGLVSPRLEQLTLEYPDSPETLTQQLSDHELRVFDAVSLRPKTHEVIAQTAGLNPGLCLHLLVSLEQAGIVQRSGARWAKAAGVVGVSKEH